MIVILTNIFYQYAKIHSSWQLINVLKKEKKTLFCEFYFMFLYIFVNLNYASP